MNYLAHLFLADDDAESLIGNLAGDFVKGPLRDQFTEGIRRGIQHHRRVDAFTDAHPSAGAFRRVLTSEHGHYARVIADMFFDHFLATNWSRYSPHESLDAFLVRVYGVIGQYVDELPGRLASVFPHMRDGQWLQSYATIEGIHQALTNISKRLSRRPHLETATHHLTDSRAELERHFHEFFPDVLALSSGPR